MANPSLVGTNAAGGTLGTNPAVTMPSSALDDLILAYGICQSGTMTMVAAGWTAHPESVGANAPLFYRWATASEPASYTFDVPGAANSACRLVVYRGVDTASPFDVDGSQAGATGAITLPTMTPSAGPDRLGVHLIAKLNNTTFTPTGGGGTFVERWDAIASNSSYAMAGGDEVLAPSVATGTRVWTPAGGAALAMGYFITLNPIPPNDGTAAGAVSSSGSAAGSADYEGSAAGSVATTGTAAGSRESSGSASGSVVASGSAQGSTDFEGSAAGTVTSSGSATGSRESAGSASGGSTSSGSATGSALHTGSAAGSVTTSGSASGENGQVNSAVGNVTASGTATGSIIRHGSASGSASASGAAAGHFHAHGSCIGNVTVSGHAHGRNQTPAHHKATVREVPRTHAVTEVGRTHAVTEQSRKTTVMEGIA